MQSKKEVADSIFSSIDIIVNRKLEKLAFNKTIIGEINRVLPNGAYEIKYQDRLFTAVSVSDNTYAKGIMVYVLLPNNNSSNTSFILGALAPEDVTTVITKISSSIETLEKQQKILTEALTLSLEGDISAAKQKLKEIGGV